MTLRARDGRRSAGSAEVVRVSAPGRLVRAGAPVLCGLALGAVSLPVPGLHLFAPWFLPLLGLGMGWYLAGVRAYVPSAAGPCPGCGAEVRAAELGSVAADPVWLRCDTCGLPLELRLQDSG